MNNIMLDFRHNYERGERLGAAEVVYQYDTGRTIEAYVPAEEGYVLNVGFENDSTLYVIEADSTTADPEGGYKVLAELPDSILTRYGNLLIYVIACDDDIIITTYEGVVTVLPKTVAEDYIIPTPEETDILERCAAAANAAGTARTVAEEKALVAEGYAVGEQDGIEVESGTYYHNNAKYYSDRASSADASATSAAADALIAEGFAVGKQGGTDVEEGSDYYHNNAKYYSEQAAESAAVFVIDDTLTETGQAADAKAVGDALSAINTNIPIKVYKSNYDVSTSVTTYENVVTFNATAGKSYIIFASAFYASGQPNGIKLLMGANTIKTVESNNYLDINFCYTMFASSAATLYIQEKRAFAGRHTGTVIIIEL